MKDFEDAIQVSPAKLNALDGVITRNVQDFAGTSVEVYNPTSFLTK